ncbi:myo-inositol 2-dehydrogenase / D-chiro-inositol 1-dehydrogenase [Asanoa hainanensis]|uniref:Myo-inositol 2-dehydrogenase / D-chiro-inositol 1-dehydrogenase n=1 Tax=Asanoa hainanensis TaxID=560556 RepID=A0A239MZV9_9ACTN|nr:Gfo/Idh/MocA family oxidoreductase [Asanoa hainanensis]SNT48040.1 myo-inositol 2-dehydrogenase / D-chiro-inositol 1-dehydrogenase [Asanoa hainanensis]
MNLPSRSRPDDATDPVRVGVVGVGVMGADHARRIAHRVTDAVLAGVCDPVPGRASAAVPGARVFASPEELISSPEVDAVLIASPGAAHEEQVLACLAAGKYVLCEKPLTLTVSSARRLVAAEAAGGRPLVQVGFMRRFDPAYTRLHGLLPSVGRLLVVHNVHRNVSAPASFTSEMIVRDSLVHEVDVCRWLFADEIATVRVLSPTPSGLAPVGVQDPQVAIFEMAGGGIATTGVFVNSQVGYEVRCEAVGETDSLFVPAVRPLAASFLTRFASAYDIEVQAWVSACRRGVVVGPRLQDGLAATAATEAGVRSLRNGGKPVAVSDVF